MDKAKNARGASKKKNGASSGVKGTRVREAYERLRADILNLTLEPGAILDEREQEARLRLSRTPIHEAFVRLEAEGLLIMEPNRQAQVLPLDIRDLPFYVEAMDLAHRSVVHLAAIRRTDDDLAAMHAAADRFEAAVKERDPLILTERNQQFHSTVASACHNPYLFANYDRLLTLGLRMLRSSHVYKSIDVASLKRQAEDHREIIGVIQARDAARVEQLAHRHTKAFVDHLIRSLQDNIILDIPIFARKA